MFDDSLPRFQDYDLVLRLIPNFKISFTNDALVNLYRQDNSISNSYEKMEIAVKIMINKKYPYSEKKRIVLNESLIRELTTDCKNNYTNIINIKNSEYSHLKETSNKEKQKLLEKYEKEKEYYEKELSKLNSKIDELEKEQKYMIKSKLYKFFKKKILRK